MKKKINLLIFILLFTTGCSCQYDLVIDGTTYKETTYIVGSNSEEINNLNTKWEIPINKDNYYIGDESTNYKSLDSIYDYSFNKNTLKLSHTFNRGEFTNSTMASACYKSLTTTNYQGSAIISTNNVASCFETYPNLNNVVINITVNEQVRDHNADSVNGNTYTWKIDKNNYKNKGINLIYKNTDKEDNSNQGNNGDSGKEKETDYGMFIFAGILLIIVLIIYGIFNFIKNKNDEMDD